MFLSLLDPAQQRLFIQAARLVAEQDGETAEVEEALLDSVMAECALDEDPGTAPEDEVLPAAREALAGHPHARNAFMLELAGVAVIDGHAAPAELSALSRFAAGLGVDDEALASFVAFAADARSLVERGQELIATGVRV